MKVDKEPFEYLDVEEGWRRVNPFDEKCKKCGSTDLNYFFYDREVYGAICMDCGFEYWTSETPLGVRDKAMNMRENLTEK